MPRKCFVISPIGEEGSPIREHADDVYEYIIKPAMEQCGFEPYRSDHLKEPGRISEQMLRAILSEELCIALLTGFNPNVFYELAVAQAARRPLIILLEKGSSMPFDIKDMRAVSYDLKPRSLFDQVYAKQIVEHVESLEAAGWKVEGLLDGVLPSSSYDFDFFSQVSSYGGPDRWLSLLQDTKHRFDIMGIHLDAWKKSRGFKDAVLAKARAGCRIRAMIVHPTNPWLPGLINDSDALEDVYADIDRMVGYFDALVDEAGAGVEFRQMQKGLPVANVALADARGIVVQYLYSSDRSNASPLWEVHRRSALYAAYTREFEALWRANAQS
jgi:hypothetical protein